jgi:drug/metabolite transporter (DMT)-like permease
MRASGDSRPQTSRGRTVSASPASAKLSPRAGILILLGVGATFAANHVAARVAFDHGTSIAAAVGVRATATALALLVLMKVQGVPLTLPRSLLPYILGVGVLVAVQSYCLYSAVAVIPAALALLVFQTSVMLYVLLCWTTGKEAPRLGSLAAMLVVLAGLALVLDVRPERITQNWSMLGAGLVWAFAAAVAFAVVYFANAYLLNAVDGRLRTFTMTSVTAVLAWTGGGMADALAVPADRIGWLGLVLLTVLYGVALSILFVVLPRVPPSNTAALNFEPIAALILGWIFLGQAVTLVQVAGAFIVVGSIAWLAARK